MKTLHFKSEYGYECDIWFEEGTYWDGNYSVYSWCEDGPFAHVTVNPDYDGDEHLLDKTAYFNIGDGLDKLFVLMVEEGIVEPIVGEYKRSGYNTYPLVKFTEKLKEYCK